MTARLHPDAAPEGRCPDCDHGYRFHGPRSRLCFFPTHHDGPACGCTRPRPEGDSRA